MTERVLFASNNPGKLEEISAYMAGAGIQILTPADLGAHLDVEETADTLEANAELKALAWAAAAPGLTVLADDTGFEIDVLGGQPGIFVRRWKDQRTEMTDEEIRDHCMAVMAGVPPARRGAQLRSVIAVARPGRPVVFCEGALRGRIVTRPAALTQPGLPIESLLWIDEWEMLLGALRDLPAGERQRLLTHRTKAARSAVELLTAAGS